MNSKVPNPGTSYPMNDGNQHKPSCFGNLDAVFPLAEDGLRHSPDICMTCGRKTECLRTAMKNEKGLKVREELVDRAYQSKKITFFERWARKKYLKQKRQREK